MPKFIKKPIPIEAVQWHKMGDHPAVVEEPKSPTGYAIKTLENTETGQHVSPGDWIITGVRGENYPIKPEIFEETYERVEDE